MEILIKETWRMHILVSGKSDFRTRKIKINREALYDNKGFNASKNVELVF